MKQNNLSGPSSALMWLLFIGTATMTLSSYSQQSQRHWVVGKTMLRFSDTPNTKTAPSIIHMFGTDPTTAANSVTDERGNLLFYVRNWGIYSPAHSLVQAIPTIENGSSLSMSERGHEVSIVPFIEPLGCVRRFYVFYQYFDGANEISLRALIVSVDMKTGQVQATSFDQGGLPVKLISLVYQPTWSAQPQTGLVVTGLKNGKRYLYMFAQGGVYKVTIENGNKPDYGLTTDGRMTLPGYPYHTYQATLSEDGSKIAWGNIQPNGNWRNNFFVATIDTQGNFVGIFHHVMWNNQLWPNEFACVGVAFNQDATKLFATTGATEIHPRPEGIYVIDLATNSAHVIPNTNVYGRTQLKLASNGLIYAISGNGMTGFDPVTEQMVHTVQVFSPYYEGLDTRIHYLPDQIFPDPVADAPRFENAIDPVTHTYRDMVYTSGLTTWDPAAFGGRDTIRITGQVLVDGEGTGLKIENMTVEFDDSTEILTMNGATLLLSNCTLKGLDTTNFYNCKTGMWKGLRVLSSDPLSFSKVSALVSPTEAVQIRDARTGILASGVGARIEATHLHMTANETQILLHGGALLGEFSENTLDGTAPLVNQQLGSNKGYPDQLNRTISGIVAWDASMSAGTNNLFLGGQFGIQGIQPRVSTIAGCTFTEQKQSGVYIQKAPPTTVVTVSSNEFNGCYDGLTVSGSKEAVIRVFENVFDGTDRFGIDAFDNNGAEFHIGDVDAGILNQPNLGNTFTNSGTAAIYLHNNAAWDVSNNSGTQIHIYFNNINTTKDNTSGIVLSEASSGTRKYQALRVYGNTITNTNWGVITTNIVGANPRDPKGDKISNYPVGEIRQNNITVQSSSWAPANAGIEVSASTGINHYENSIQPSANGNRYNRSLSIKTSPNTLVYKNFTYTGWGLMAQGSMLNSNYYCNYFTRAHQGINLTNHSLRGYVNGYPEHHGIIDVEARNNTFVTPSAGSSDIHVVESSPASNQWVFTSTTPFITYDISFDPYPSIPIGVAPDKCSVENTPYDPEQGEVVAPPDGAPCIEQFYADYYNQQQFRMGHQPTGVNSDNIVKLVDAETLMARGENYQDALDLVDLLNPSSEACQEYADVISDYQLLYRTYLVYKLLDSIPRNMDSAGIAILVSIASKNAITQSPAALSARAILWDEKQLRIDGEPFEPQPAIAGYLDWNTCEPESMEDLPVYLLDENEQVVEGPVLTDANGQFGFSPSVVTTYENDPAMYHMVMVLADGRLIYSQEATVADLAMMSNHEMLCSEALQSLSITGYIMPESMENCSLATLAGIPVYLIDHNTGLEVEGPLYSDDLGYFAFDPIVMAKYNNTNLYKLRVNYPNNTVVYTAANTIADMAAEADYQFTCQGIPEILGKRGKEPVKAKKDLVPIAERAATPFGVSPNPSTGTFTVTGVQGNARVTITNLLGQIVVNDLPLQNGTVNASSLQSGIYMLTVTDNNTTHVRKIHIIK